MYLRHPHNEDNSFTLSQFPRYIYIYTYAIQMTWIMYLHFPYTIDNASTSTEQG